MNKVVRFVKRGAVGILSVDNPPVNAMDYKVRIGLSEGLAAAVADMTIQVIVLACKGRTFIAGADIREFATGLREPLWHTLVNQFDNCPKPLVAALFGTAYGGGLEIALGCHYRVGCPSLKCALPEVKLGIIPGAGGTQRLPRLIGVEKSVEMITTGEPIDANLALSLGLLDEIVTGDLIEEAIRFAKRVMHTRPLPRPLMRVVPKISLEYLSESKKRLMGKYPGFEAPLRCLKAIQAVSLPVAGDGLAREWELFNECLASPQSKAMQYVFFSERSASRVHSSLDLKDVKKIALVGIIGAGKIGANLAFLFANSGYPVLLFDKSVKMLETSLGKIAKRYSSCYANLKRILDLITPIASFDKLASADLIVLSEADEIDRARETIQEIVKNISGDAIIAANTNSHSGLFNDHTIAHTERMAFFCFSNEYQWGRLVEVMPGEMTVDSTLRTLLKTSKALSLVGVNMKRSIRSRIFKALRRETGLLILEGTDPYCVDKTLMNYGFEMGPFLMDDLIGLDLIRRLIGPSQGEKINSDGVVSHLCLKGNLGKNVNMGYYRYESGSSLPKLNPDMEKILVQVSKSHGISRRRIGQSEILERCLSCLVHEGRKILEEKIVKRASDFDLVCIYGLGFPAYRGGPMYNASLN